MTNRSLLANLLLILTRGAFIFWVVSVGCFSAFVMYFPEVEIANTLHIKLSQEGLPAAILLFSLVATSIYSYVFLLLPITRNSVLVFGTIAAANPNWLDRLILKLKSNHRRRQHKITMPEKIFHFSFWVTAFFSLGVALHYLVLLIPESRNWTWGSIATSLVLFFQGFDFVKDHHLLIFAALYTLLDFIVWKNSQDNEIGDRFEAIVFVVDMPMLFSMAFIDFVLKHLLTTDLFTFFAAGVNSFQLIAGSLAIVVLEAIDLTGNGSRPRT